jgi:hypothetical protein
LPVCLHYTGLTIQLRSENRTSPDFACSRVVQASNGPIVKI